MNSESVALCPCDIPLLTRLVPFQRSVIARIAGVIAGITQRIARGF